jgi:hypothetical protein
LKSTAESFSPSQKEKDEFFTNLLKKIAETNQPNLITIISKIFSTE